MANSSITRRVLVLGGHGDIGSAIVQRFREAGDQVTSLGRQDLDLTNPKAIDSYFATHSKEYDVLVQSAGWNNPKKVESVSREDIETALSVNTLGFLYTAQVLIPSFKERKSGSILAISSLYGSFSRVGRLAYSTAKHALNGVVKTLALELGPFNIRVNSISPGFIDTKLTRKNNDSDTIRSLERKIPLGNKLGQPEDIAHIAYFLCSSQNNFIHGQDIVADGGYSIGGFQE